MPRRDYNLSRIRSLGEQNDYPSILRSTTRVTRAKIPDLIATGIIVQSSNACKLVFSEKIPRLCAKITRDSWINDGVESYTSVSSWLSSNLLRYGIKISMTEDVAWTMVDFCGKNFAIVCDAYWNYCSKRGRYTFTTLSVETVMHKHKPSKEISTLIKCTSDIKQKILDIIGDGQTPKANGGIVMDFNKSPDSGANASDDDDNDDSQQADSKDRVLKDGQGANEKGEAGRKRGDGYDASFNDCKVPPMRDDLFFVEDNNRGIRLGFDGDPEQKSRKHADYIPHELVSAVECPVCFDVLDAPVALPCSKGHPVCSSCVRDLIKFSLGTTTGHVESRVPVKCPVCSEVMQLPAKAEEFEAFFKKVELDPKAAEFVAHLGSKDSSSASSAAPLSCPKHNSEFVSYDIGLGIPLCGECVAERGSEVGVTLPMKSCSSIVRHTTDILSNASLEFENMCEEYVSALDQASVFLDKSARNVENAIIAEAEFLHDIINRKRTSLIYNAHKVGKQRLIELRDNGFCEKDAVYYEPLVRDGEEVKGFFRSWGGLGLEKIDLTKSDLHVEMEGPLVECGSCVFFIVVRNLRTTEGNVPSSYALAQKAYLDLLEFSIFSGDTPVHMSLHGNWRTRDAKGAEVKTEYVCQARADLQLSGFYTLYASVSPSPSDRCSICEFFVEPSPKRRK